MGSNSDREHPLQDVPDGKLETGKILAALYNADPGPKITLMDGLYRNEDDSPFVPKSVKEARKRLVVDDSWNHEYPPFLGLPAFLEASLNLFYGEKSLPVISNRIAAMQTVGATGACLQGASFLLKFYKHWTNSSERKVYLTKESWVNYRNIFSALGIQCEELLYYDHHTKSLDFTKYKAALEKLPEFSVVVLQASAHNPTGCDPSIAQWREIKQVFLNRGHFAFMDSAYLGLVSGNPESDLEVGSIRMFANANVPMLLAATYGKCFSLYGERVGVLSILAPNVEVKRRMEKQMLLLARSSTGASPSFGAKIVESILNDRELRNQWCRDLAEVAEEIGSRRQMLKDELEAHDTPGDWSSLTRQVGMFSCLGLSETEIESLRRDHHIYIDKNSRVCFGTLYKRNITRVAQSISVVLKAHGAKME